MYPRLPDFYRTLALSHNGAPRARFSTRNGRRQLIVCVFAFLCVRTIGFDSCILSGIKVPFSCDWPRLEDDPVSLGESVTWCVRPPVARLVSPAPSLLVRVRRPRFPPLELPFSVTRDTAPRRPGLLTGGAPGSWTPGPPAVTPGPTWDLPSHY